MLFPSWNRTQIRCESLNTRFPINISRTFSIIWVVLLTVAETSFHANPISPMCFIVF